MLVISGKHLIIETQDSSFLGLFYEGRNEYVVTHSSDFRFLSGIASTHYNINVKEN